MYLLAQHRRCQAAWPLRKASAAPEVAAPEISAPEVPASEVAASVAASEVPAAVVPAAGITVGVDDWGRQKLSEQEPGEQAGTEAVTAPVGRGEAGVDVVD